MRVSPRQYARGVGVRRLRSTIFTIGFTKKTAEEFFRLLTEAQVSHLIDVRENRIGQLSGFAKYPDLAFFLDRLAGIEYRAEPMLAPSPEIRTAYAKSRDWQQYESSFLELMRERRVLETINPQIFEGRVALLCSEPTADRCHRRLVAEILSSHWNSLGHEISIEHLASKKPTAKRKE